METQTDPIFAAIEANYKARAAFDASVHASSDGYGNDALCDAANAAFDAIIPIEPTTHEGDIAKIVAIADEAVHVGDWLGILSLEGTALAIARSAAAVASFYMGKVVVVHVIEKALVAAE